jgi:hypothetical protein
VLGQVRQPAREPLSQRELDILGLIARGCSNPALKPARGTHYGPFGLMIFLDVTAEEKAVVFQDMSQGQRQRRGGGLRP